MKFIIHWINRWRRHLSDIESHLDYPDIMAPPLPRGTDCRGQAEMESHWETRRKMQVKRKEILDASSDPDKAGYKPNPLDGGYFVQYTPSDQEKPNGTPGYAKPNDLELRND